MIAFTLSSASGLVLLKLRTDGHALVPMAVTAEWMAHAAIHGNPGLLFHGFDELRVLKGVVLGETGTVKIRLMAARALKDGSSFVVPVEMHSVSGGREFLNARASIILVPGLPNAPYASDLVETDPYTLDPKEIYRRILFHGPDFQGITKIEGCSTCHVPGLASGGRDFAALSFESCMACHRPVNSMNLTTLLYRPSPPDGRLGLAAPVEFERRA